MRRISVSFILLSLFGYQALYAQGTRATLSGTVFDEKERSYLTRA